MSVSALSIVNYSQLGDAKVMASCDHLQKDSKDLSYNLIAEQKSKIIGTTLCKLRFPQHSVVFDNQHLFIYFSIPIHLYPNKFQDIDFLATRLKQQIKEIERELGIRIKMDFKLYLSEWLMSHIGIIGEERCKDLEKRLGLMSRDDRKELIKKAWIDFKKGEKYGQIKVIKEKKKKELMMEGVY